MKNRRVSVSASDLNNRTTITVDPTMEFTSKDRFSTNVVQTLYPIDIQVVNNTGSGVEFNAFLSREEYEEYLTATDEEKEEYFVFQRIPSGTTLQSDHTNFPQCYRFLVRGYDGVATSDLYIEFLNYR